MVRGNFYLHGPDVHNSIKGETLIKKWLSLYIAILKWFEATFLHALDVKWKGDSKA